MVNSREKGKIGERAARDYLRSLGFEDARRGMQYSGIDGRDVVCLDSLPELHFEVKFGYPIQSLDIGKGLHVAACQQAERDANGKSWAVLWKPKGQRQWRLTCIWYGVLATVAKDGDVLLMLEYLGRGK